MNVHLKIHKLMQGGQVITKYQDITPLFPITILLSLNKNPSSSQMLHIKTIFNTLIVHHHLVSFGNTGYNLCDKNKKKTYTL